uniref:Uncharacterized protein n=1 Tax=Ditylenchus dipsaci TaxID=166011 RepID=A0A915DHC7_9BILA
MASQVEFYGISNGALRHLRWSSLAILLDSNGISGKLLSGPIRKLWWSTATLRQFYGNFDGLLHQLKWTSTASSVDHYGISGDF